MPCYYPQDKSITIKDKFESYMFKLLSHFNKEAKNYHAKQSVIIVNCLNILNYIAYVQASCPVIEMGNESEIRYNKYRNHIVKDLIEKSQTTPQKVYNSIASNADLLTEYLCELLRRMDKKQLNKILKKHKGISLWWEQHQKEDTERNK